MCKSGPVRYEMADGRAPPTPTQVMMENCRKKKAAAVSFEFPPEDEGRSRGRDDPAQTKRLAMCGIEVGDELQGTLQDVGATVRQIVMANRETLSDASWYVRRTVREALTRARSTDRAAGGEGCHERAHGGEDNAEEGDKQMVLVHVCDGNSVGVFEDEAKGPCVTTRRFVV